MKKITTSLLLLSFLLGACSNKSTATQAAIPQNPNQTTAPVVTESSATPSPSPARQALLSEIENKVLARVLSSNELSPASNGLSIFEAGSVETGADSRARLDLTPDGTIVRVSPNSSFILSALMTENNEPRTKIELLFGQVFILLNGGSLDVETPSGVASVRGSLMSVTYSPDLNRTTTTCLEGHCVVEDDDEELELTEGQAADFIDGELENDYREMTFEELGLWMLDNPDLEEHIGELPDLTGLPVDFDWNYDFNSDPEFEFFFDPEYDPGEQIIDPEFEIPFIDDGILQPPAPVNEDPPSP